MLLVISSVLGQTQKPSAPTGTPIKIGGSLQLTGIFSEPAKWIREGYNFWADWAPGLPYPGNKEINEGAKRRLGLPQPPDFFGQGYCWMKTLELAVQGSGTLDPKRIRDYLRSQKFDLPYGLGIKFDSRGLPPPYAFTVVTTGGKNVLVWPKEVSAAKLVYPRPSWSK